MIEFEIRDRDLLARIGKLRTKSGTVETPIFLPVINPSKVSVPPKEMQTLFGCKMLITNAYIVKKRFENLGKERGIHNLLEFQGVVMTDSGAYQILAYGNVDVTPEEIVRYQEEINADIATILDIPTGWKVSKEHAQSTVEETIRRAKELEKLKTRREIAWVGPIQGGRYLDLVATSAKEMARLPFDVYALGSPTPVMEQYLFDLLVDMVLTAKMNLPPSRPFHLFGAGHPLMFSLAVALGCDLFDSAAYSIFAQEGRYLTDHGTMRLEKLRDLPCSCPICAEKEPRDLLELPQEEREREMERHNLYVCFSEIRKIKQAIVEGRLWEHIEARAHGHPALLQALKHLKKYSEYIEKFSPIAKRSGLFFYGSVDLARPEVTRHRKRLFERYSPPKTAKILLLVPIFGSSRAGRSRLHKKALAIASKKLKLERSEVHVCFYAPPFGVIPTEIGDVYPLSQFEFAYPPDYETIEYVAEQVSRYIETSRYEKAIILLKSGTWSEKAVEICSRICAEKEVALEALDLTNRLFLI